MLAQQLVNGIVVGAVYSLFSLGFTLIFGMHRILNLAHGAVFMWGALIGYFCVTSAGISLLPAFVAAVLGAGMLSVALDLLVYRPLRKRNGDEFGTIIAGIGANLVLMSVAQQITNAQALRFPFGIFPVVFYRIESLGLRISLQQIVIVGTVAVLTIGLLAYLFKTRIGTDARAVAINEQTSTLLGVNANLVYLSTFFIAGALAGAAGVILGIAFNSVSYIMGEPIMLQAFVVIVLGGLGSVVGAIFAGLLLGIIQTISVVYISSELSDAIVFGLLFLVLLLRPNGFFAGLHTEHRVA
jgi:branched-chain amino acid transport system permease protein